MADGSGFPGVLCLKMVGGRGGGFRVLLLSEFQGEKGQGCWALSTVLLRVDAVGRKG